MRLYSTKAIMFCSAKKKKINQNGIICGILTTVRIEVNSEHFRVMIGIMYLEITADMF